MAPRDQTQSAYGLPVRGNKLNRLFWKHFLSQDLGSAWLPHLGAFQVCILAVDIFLSCKEM